MEVQVCSIVCRYATTDADGNFEQGGLEGALFKVDAMGATWSQPGYGNALYGVELATSENFAIPAPLVVPPVNGPEAVPETAGTETYTLGNVSVTFAANEMSYPFGAVDRDTGELSLFAGAIEGAAIPPLWSITPSIAVTLLPWATQPGGPMDIEVTGVSVADGSYSVYSLAEYGEIEGPLGTGTVSGGTASVSGIQPSVWTWIFFVPN
jgi:hypothetical protein